MNQRIFDIIAFSIQRIEEFQDWSAFDELVLNSQSHSAQLEYLSGSVFKENGLHPGNGWGKSEVLARKHLKNILKHFLDGDKYKTLNIAITIEQAELVQEKIVHYIDNSPMLRGWLLGRNGIVKKPVPIIRYSNGAKTDFKTTKKKAESVEGIEYGYISADEIALEQHLEFIRDKILLPRLRAWTDSQLDFSATPKGMNAYYRIIKDIKRKGGYVRGGSSYENPYIDHNLLDYQCSTWSEPKVAQIIKGLFIDTAEMMFASRVDNLFDSSLTLQEVERGHKYIECWDLARGRKGSQSDQTVGYRIDITRKPHLIVKRWAFQLPWTEKERENINKQLGKDAERSSTEREIRNAQYESGADVLLDSTGIGDTLYGILQDIAKPVDFRGGNKDKILDHLQAVIDAGLLKSPFIPELADQMTVYQREDRNLETDDIMSLAVGCSAIKIKKQNYGTVAG
ncbi:MAG: hypothetical protein KAS32_14015 [Candidatus Peribacteraceae bacterium]|nr:hypothetical protein [Candidatus Peribacteraceae bacterium]